MYVQIVSLFRGITDVFWDIILFGLSEIFQQFVYYE